MDQPLVSPPHVLIFPFPGQGHVNGMLRLAELLSLAGLRITFLIPHYNHHRLQPYYGSVLTRLARYPGFRFETIPDGLPMEHPRTADLLKDIFNGVQTVTKPFFAEKMINSWCRLSETCPPVTCVIADGVLSFAIDVANQVGVPIIYFRTVSACSFWAYYCLDQIIEAGEVPFKEDDLDLLVKSLPGTDGTLRRRDLPSFCRVGDINDPALQMVMKETRQTDRTHGLILNTFEDLEGPVLSQIRSRCPKTYVIGPLHEHLKSRLASETTPDSQPTKTAREEDKSCIEWLDRQMSKSVIYVSFGTVVEATKDELVEFWYGLVNSGCHFLWVIRSDSLPEEVDGEDRRSAELLEGTKKRGLVVSWAPQEDVLLHPAVGGFLTHSGWNSTLESIAAGVPMVCWPGFADQQINSRFVSHVWKLGVDMKDTCDRITIEKMVRNLMEEKRMEFLKSAERIATSAKESVSEGGSSCRDLMSLIDDIRSMSTACLLKNF